jgi:phenylacetic acid degradation operon negative regulatory protein
MRFKAQAEDWLSVLLWGAEKLMFPTWSKLFESYEWWEYKQRMRHHVRHLEQRRLLSRENRAGQIVYRLTETGRLTAMGGVDPPRRWRRAWDGRWRMILFDLPVSHKRVRMRLWRWLRDNDFGYLQDSVWIHPDPVEKVTAALRDFRDDVESFTLMEARCYRGHSNEAIVLGGWDFEEINRRYRLHLEIASVERARLLRDQLHPAGLTQWLNRERIAWAHALALDPLLPRVLHPPGYLGDRAWQARRAALREVAARLASAQLR